MVVQRSRKDRKRERKDGDTMAVEEGKGTSEVPQPEPSYVLDSGLSDTPSSRLEVGREN